MNSSDFIQYFRALSPESRTVLLGLLQAVNEIDLEARKIQGQTRELQGHMQDLENSRNCPAEQNEKLIAEIREKVDLNLARLEKNTQKQAAVFEKLRDAEKLLEEGENP